MTILTVLPQFHHGKIGTKNLIKLWEWTACSAYSNCYCMEWRTKGLTRHLIVIVLKTWKWEVKWQLNSYLVGDRTSKQKRRSPSRTGFTVHSRRSSSITVIVSSPRHRHYYINTKCALYRQMRTSNAVAIYLRASRKSPALNSHTHKTFQLTQTYVCNKTSLLHDLGRTSECFISCYIAWLFHSNITHDHTNPSFRLNT